MSSHKWLRFVYNKNILTTNTSHPCIIILLRHVHRHKYEIFDRFGFSSVIIHGNKLYWEDELRAECLELNFGISPESDFDWLEK